MLPQTNILTDSNYDYEVEEAFLTSNLFCGCEVTILIEGTTFINRCNTEDCLRTV